MFKLLPLLLLCACENSDQENKMQTATYGSWESPISAKIASSGALKFSEVKLAGGTVYWLEGRPMEKGRNALMSWSPSEGEKELLPSQFNVRNRVHEYGGGSLLIAGNDIYFINDEDQQIYCLRAEGEIKKITAQPNARFADGAFNPDDGFLYYVMEEHGSQVDNSIVRIDPSHASVQKVASGFDFYANPRVSPDGKSLAYICWSHPNMPWDGTELYVLDLQSQKAKLVAGGVNESVVDPIWSREGELYYVSDRSNWWNIYRENDAQPLFAIEGEFALPQWIFGRSLIAFTNEGMIGSYIQAGQHAFARSSESGKWRNVDLPFTDVETLTVEGNQMAMIAGSPEIPEAIILYDLQTSKTSTVKISRSDQIDPRYISHPTAVQFPSAGGRVSHAFYYPPTNPNFKGNPGEKPPLIVHSHGGPTGHSSPLFSMGVLYWTSRGFAIIDVNYGGSTGYGRRYRDALKGAWGIVDVDDCTNAALYLADQGLADPKRLAIEGGSAGGYTTLAALAFRNVFQVGADYFGVSDLERLTLDTHKFESRYLEQLIGPYPADRATYIKRSPIYSVDTISCPIIIFQGDEDAIVPPSQSEEMYNSLIERNIPTAYLLYKGEQHGFRKAENIQRSLEAQLYFFSKVMGFPLSEKIESVNIVNLQE